MIELILETGKVKLRCGHKVRIHATDLMSEKPILLSYLLPGKGWLVLQNSLNGKHSSGADDHPFDLVPIPQAQYFNVYEESDGRCLIASIQDDIRDVLTEAEECYPEIASFETFRYCDGEITKVEPEEDE